MNAEQTGTTPVLYTEEYNTIAGSLARGEIGLLIGAGMSKDSGIPGGERMAQRMLHRAVLGKEKGPDLEDPNKDEPSETDALAIKYPFEAIAEYLDKQLPHNNYASWLKSQGGMGKGRPTEAHKWLRELHTLLPHRFPRLVFTTNFDTLIEDEFNRDTNKGSEVARCITTETMGDLPETREKNQIAVIHLHGCVDYPRSVVVGETPQATLRGPIFDLLRAALATDVFAFVGYSLLDTDLRSVFFEIQSIAATRQGLRKRTFAISPESGLPEDKSSPAGIARAIWDLRNVAHIAVTAEEFFHSLFEATEDFVMVKIKHEVARALGMEVATLNERLRTATEHFRVIKPDDLLTYLYYTLTPVKE